MRNRDGDRERALEERRAPRVLFVYPELPDTYWSFRPAVTLAAMGYHVRRHTEAVVGDA
jgi:hypothetical protein